MNGTQSKKNRKQIPNDSTSKPKNVSWANTEKYSDCEDYEKKLLPSTPYPKATKKIKISANSTPKSLSFAPCDSDENDDSFTIPENKKRKRSKKKSTWVVTSCSEVKPDKTNKPLKQSPRYKKTKTLTDSNQRIVNTRNGSYIFDEHTFASEQIARKVLKNVMKDEVEELLDDLDSTFDSDSESPDELIPIEENFNSSSIIVFESSSDESTDSNLDVIFNPPEIKLDEKSCQIIEPKVKTLKRNKKKSSEKNFQLMEEIKKSTEKAKSTFEKKNNPQLKEKNKKNTEIKTKSTPEKSSQLAEEIKNITKIKTKSTPEKSPQLTEEIKNITENETKSTPEMSLQLTEEIKNIDILEKIEYYISDTYCIIILKHPFKLYFNGKLSVVVLSGKLEVLGHILKFNNETESEIYNPRGQSFLCLETLESKKNPNISNVLQKYLDGENLTKVWKTLNDNDCIIVARNLKNNMTEYLEKHTAQHLYPDTLQFTERPLMKLENELSCLFETETAPYKLYKKHADWEKLANESLLKIKENNSRSILCGGKSVGKSTLLRYMINYMLNEVNEVVCIDLDPGQSEFTISGCVSVTVLDSPIFGPNYTHLKKPKKSFFIGDVNVTNVLDRYITSVKELIDFCDKNISKKLPWIINCMGFSKSIGTDIIVLIIKLLKPSIVVQLESSKRNRNYYSHLSQEFVNNFIPSFPLQIPNNKVTYSLEILNSMAEELVSGEWISEPRLLREMCILSYFSQMLEDKKEITAAISYGVKLSAIKLHNINYSHEHILATMNGNLVALCESNEMFIKTKTLLPCNGFGIVRGIDKQSGELYLLTPIEESLLENVNLLVRGNIPLPPSIFMTTGHQGLVPYIQLGTLQGTSAIPKRSFISWKVLLNKK